MNMRDLGLAAFGIVAVSWIVRPGNDSARLLNAHHQAISNMIRVATMPGIEPAVRRSEAEVFAEQARESIAEFWAGFSDYVTGD